MRKYIAIGLIVTGLALIGIGLTGAIAQLGSLYSGASNDPLGEPSTDEQSRADSMLYSAIIGGAGVPMLGFGTILLTVRRCRKRS